jgi:hypothetical protein
MRWRPLASGKWLSTVSHLCIDTIGDARVCRLAITAELRDCVPVRGVRAYGFITLSGGLAGSVSLPLRAS